MRSGVTRAKIAYWILAFAAGQSVSATAPAQASGLNLTFDRNVLDEIEPTIDLADASEPAVVDPTQKPARTTLQETIGLTKQEAESVSIVVEDYRSRNGVFADAMKPLRGEALYKSLEDRQTTAALERKIHDLQADRAAMIASAMDKLKDMLGASRLQALDDYVQARRQRIIRLYFPVRFPVPLSSAPF
jgi:hypothetical protein